jgi:GNAT superfamily N-acetyltransferase
MSDVQVRAFKVADENSVLALAREEMRALEKMDPRLQLSPDAGDRYTVYLRDRLRDLDSAVFVAERGDAIVGLGIATIRRQRTLFAVQRYGYVSDLFVAPDARRSGVGKLLFERLGVWLRSHGIQVVRLHVAECNETGRMFWKKLGAAEFMTEMWLELKQVPAAGDEAAAGDDVEATPAEASSARTEDPPGGI